MQMILMKSCSLDKAIIKCNKELNFYKKEKGIYQKICLSYNIIELNYAIFS